MFPLRKLCNTRNNHREGRDISLSPQLTSFPGELYPYFTLVTDLCCSSHKTPLVTVLQETGKEPVGHNNKTSQQVALQPAELAMLYRRFRSQGQAGTLPRAVTMTMSHIQCSHSCTKENFSKPFLLLLSDCKSSLRQL